MLALIPFSLCNSKCRDACFEWLNRYDDRAEEASAGIEGQTQPQKVKDQPSEA